MRPNRFWLKIAEWALLKYYKSYGRDIVDVEIRGFYGDYLEYTLIVRDKNAGVMS